MSFPSGLGVGDVAAWDASVVHRYLSLFGEAALDMLLTARGGDLAHLGCRTGYPDTLFATRLGEGTIVGVDPSPAALKVARQKAAFIQGVRIEYRQADRFPTDLPSASFTHVVSLHPEPLPSSRRALLEEMARLLLPTGQALLALPMRGSFQEIVDLLREYTVKHDDVLLSRALDEATTARPTVDLLTEELERAGFSHVDIDLWPTVIDFGSGRELFDDPIVRLLVVPELEQLLGRDDLDAPLAYVKEAIDCYWPSGGFELTVNVGCASGRRLS